jgi:guanylate kinase
MNRACEEAEFIERYDYLVINDELDACVKRVHEIIRSEHFKVSRSGSRIEEMKKGLKAFAAQETN